MPYDINGRGIDMPPEKKDGRGWTVFVAILTILVIGAIIAQEVIR